MSIFFFFFFFLKLLFIDILAGAFWIYLPSFYSCAKSSDIYTSFNSYLSGNLNGMAFASGSYQPQIGNI
jgi:hypothetical protein